MPKEKAKGSPHQRYGVWLFFGLIIGIAGAFVAFLGIFEPRRDMVFAETSQISTNESIFYAAYSPDWQYIYTQSSEGRFRVWDATSPNVSELEDYATPFLGMQWNPQKTAFLGMDYENAVVLFDKMGKRITAFEHENAYTAMWNPTADRVITISDTVSKLWTVDAHLLKEFPQPMALYDAALWSPDGSRFATWANDIEAGIYDADGNLLKPFALSGYPTSYGWNSTGSNFAMVQYVAETTPAEYRLVLYDANGEQVWEDKLTGDYLIWNTDGSRITVFNYVPEMRTLLYSIEGERIAEFGTATVYLWHPDGDSLLTATTEGREMQLMDKTAGVLQTLTHEGDTSYTFPQWSPNGEILATWDRRPEDSIYTLYLWDKAGNLLHKMSESTPIESIAWSPDSSRILSVGGYVARVWSVEGGEINSLNHSQPIIQALWNSDGSRILTVGAYTSSVEYENAVWTSEGEHIATLFTGDSSLSYVSQWRDDFSQVLIMTPTGVAVRSLQAGSIYFDFRFDN